MCWLRVLSRAMLWRLPKLTSRVLGDSTQLSDGRVVETVGIPNDAEPTVEAAFTEQAGSQVEGRSGRLTVCVSSQVSHAL
jgi:adenine C2-methylase RlmN of 23S rRNA A2503 and tRNA A37